MNATPFPPNSQYTTPLPCSPSAHISEPQIAPLTLDDITGDIERLICRVVSPYVDPTSFALNAEDLKGECRAKLAHIISGGHLAKCPTRAKAFGFMKASLRNHVRSLVQKYVYATKRTGYDPHSNNSAGAMLKPCHIRIDDPEMDFQLGRDDDAVRQREFLEELFCRLSPSEMAILNDLISKVTEPRGAAGTFGATGRRGRPHVSESVRKARAGLLQKCRAILEGSD